MVILPGSARLLWLSSLRYLLRHPAQALLNFGGILLAVMMVVAIDLANSSASRAFEYTLATISGNITHQISGGPRGIPEGVYTELRTQLGLRRSAPVLSGQLDLNGEAFNLIGLDVLSELSLQRQRPGLDLQGNVFAREDFLTLLFGEELLVTENQVFADIGLAQHLLDMPGLLSSIDLILDAEEVELVRDWLPAGLTLSDVAERFAASEQMNSSFHINLLAMSLLSLLVAGLLIYNTVTLGVLRRQQTFAILRGQGVSGRQLFRLLLGESALLGMLASLAGILLGIALGRVLLGMVSQGVPDMNFRLTVTAFVLDPWSLLRGFVLGTGVSMLAAALPAYRAGQARPVSLQQPMSREMRWQALLPYLLLAGLAMMLLGCGLILSAYGGLSAGFIALALLIGGYCLLIPGIMAGVLQAVLRAGQERLKLPLLLALRQVRGSISRSGLAVAALALAISVTVGVGIMVGSFRTTVIVWLEDSFAGDIEIMADSIPPELAAELLAVPGVESVSATTLRRVESEFGEIRLRSNPLPAAEIYYLQEVAADRQQAFNAGEGLLLSEPFAWLHGLNAGDELVLFTDQGARPFPVLGLIHDYSPGTGLAGMHESLYQRWWQDHAHTRLTIFADEGVAVVDELMPAVQEVLDIYPQGLRAVANASIRELTLEIFDRTFLITNVLRLLAVVVAFIGILSALTAMLLERLHEFGILRATGMTARQLGRLVLGQALIMGLFAGLLALPLGLLMSAVLTEVINQRSFGWSILFFPSGQVFAEAFLLAVLAALLAAIYPVIRATGLSPAEALREE